ncbi:toll/interleukin-1 receptor domain-containing protein [Sorangium sp. So ce381]|uniref:toll/interleukin-1 receptor domain-containing protein n=1 Tax=Sorangium sp. So ce381 TaxID=3133307 RepID=UPI003F5C47E8
MPNAAPKLRLLIRHSSAVDDVALADALLGHLQPLRRIAGLDVWSEGRIQAGAGIRCEIEQAIEQADVVLLLLSPDFFASDALQEVEVPRLLERRREGKLQVIPILLRSCFWQGHDWLSELSLRPESGEAIASYHGDARDRVLAELVREVAALGSYRLGDGEATHGLASEPGTQTGGPVFVTNLTGVTIPALAIGPGAQAHGSMSSNRQALAAGSDELARARFRAETAVVPFLLQHGSGFSPEDEMPVVGFEVENHGEKPFRILSARACWRRAGLAQNKAAETKILQHRVAPDGKGTVNVKILMGSGELSEFRARLKLNPYASPIEVDLTVLCANAAGYQGESQQTAGWPVPPRPAGSPRGRTPAGST